jgi:integrase/recombinase XerC
MSANVFRVGGVWHYRFQVAGIRIQKSTRLRNRGRAEQLAQLAYDAAVLRANGGEPVPTLDELAGDWLVVHRPTVSARHYTSVETFRRLHLYALGERAIGDIGTEDVELARNEHLVEHRPATANHWLRIMKLLAMWAVKRGIIAALPWKVAMLKVQKRPRAILPIDVTRVWFEAIDKATRRAPAAGTAVRLMFGLGLREGEAAGACWEWIDWERRTYTPGITKGREADALPLPDWLADYLAPHRCESGLIAPRRDGTPFPAGFARTAMRIANAACKTNGITPHRLRGTFATLLSESGAPLQDVQAALRHKHPMTTVGYLEKSMSRVSAAQMAIGAKIDFKRRESGEEQATAPSGDCIS